MVPKACSSGRASKFVEKAADMDVLSDLSRHVEFLGSNPKKRGSAASDRYERYKRARTVGEALQAGAQSADLKFDLQKGYMRVIHSLSNLDNPAGLADFAQTTPLSPLGDDSGYGTTGRSSTLLQRLASRGMVAHGGLPGQQGDRMPRERPRYPAADAAVHLNAQAAAVSPSASSSRSRLDLVTNSAGEDRKVTPPPNVPWAWQQQQQPQMQQGSSLPVKAPASAQADFITDDDDLSDGELLAACRSIENRDRSRSLDVTAGGYSAGEEAAKEAQGEEVYHATDSKAYGTCFAQQVGHQSLECGPPQQPQTQQQQQQQLHQAEHQPIQLEVVKLHPPLPQQTAGNIAASAGSPVTTTEHPDEMPAMEETCIGSSLTEAPAEEHDSSEEITLRLRFSKVLVKKEVEEETLRSAEVPRLSQSLADEEGQPGASDTPCPGIDSSLADALKPCRPTVLTSVTSATSQSAKARPSTDLRQLFANQRLAASSQSSEQGEAEQDTDPERQQQQAEHAEQVEQFEAAQIASYEQNKSERQDREARDRELVEQGDTGPLEMLDEELMNSIFSGEGMFCWLESAAHRCLLHRYLELKSRAIRWYPEPAQAYFADQRGLLGVMLEQPDAPMVVSEYLEAETERVEAALFAMPEKGRFVPELFAPHVGEEAALSQGGCVHLD